MSAAPAPRIASAPALAPASTEGWLGRRPGRVTATLLVAALFVRLLLCLQIAAGPLPRVHEIVRDSDNAFFHRWGGIVAGGDWLQRSPQHPITGWMRDVAQDAMSRQPDLPLKLGLAAGGGYDRAAMEARLWDRWLGGTTYYQEPAYPYLVGLTYGLAGARPWAVFAWQIAIGVLGVLLVHRLSRRLFGETAALAAGFLAVLAPIPLFYEATLLRDGLVAFATVALALLMHWAPEGGHRRWLALGIAFGMASLVKQSFLVFPVVMGVFRLAAVRAPARDRAVAAALVAAGMLVALLPAVVRNVVVGAPPFAMNGSVQGMLALYHVASATPFDLVVTPDMTRVLLAADGRLVGSLAEAARTHASAWGFWALNAKKLLYAWHGFEAPNNVDFYLFRQAAPLLALLPATFIVLVPLAAVGIASRGAARAWPILVAIVASVPTLVLGAVLSRYRAPITASLVPLAGAGLVRIAMWVAGRRWRPACVTAGATALYLAWAAGSPPGKEPARRARSYARLGVDAIGLGEPAFAALHLQESLRLEPGNPSVEARLAQALLLSGDAEAALPYLASAARSLDSAAFHELYARALAAAGRRAEAVAHARAAASADPAGAQRRALLERLEREAGPADERRPVSEESP